MNLEIFRDQIWNFIGVLIACITLVITVVVYFLQKRKKGLSYAIVSKTALLTTKEKLEGRIKILFNESEVQNVNFFQIRIINTGNLSIASSDYERPLKFIFATEAKILSAEIVKSTPPPLTTSLSINKNEIVTHPILMNAKDNMTIKLIVANSVDNRMLPFFTSNRGFCKIIKDCI